VVYFCVRGSYGQEGCVMLEYDQIIDAIIQRVKSLHDRDFRIYRICDELVRFSDFEVANLFEELYLGSIQKRPHYIMLLEALTNFDVVRERFGARLSPIFEIADKEGLLLAVEWLSPLPIQQKVPKGLFVHHDLEHITLGERKWMARKVDPHLIDKLLVDPDPAVITNLLNHPRLTEDDVMKICTKIPNHPDIMEAVYQNPRWFARYNIKKALLNNPVTSSRVVMLILVYLSVQDLRDLLKSRRFSPGFILQILRERKRGNSGSAPSGSKKIESESQTVPSDLPTKDAQTSLNEYSSTDDDEDDTGPNIH